MTHYKILDLSPEATPAEVKRAYRRLAMRWHPDRNDHPEATERFKEIRAAYEALAVRAEEQPASASDAETPAEAPSRAQAADIRFNLEITLAEGFAGCRKMVSYQRGHACPTCDGTGEHGISRTRFCGECHGSGRLRDQQSGLVNCHVCAGRGFFIERKCPDCAGSGRDTADVSLQVKIPPGMLSGDDLRLSGQGEPAMEELAAGDLFLTIIIAEHAHFRLQGRDLHLEMPVNALSLLVGGEIVVPLPVGAASLSLAAGSVELRQLRVAGRGYPGRGKMPAGDLHLTLRPVFPSNLDAKQRKLLQQCIAALDSQTADGNFPEIAAWRAALGG